MLLPSASSRLTHHVKFDEQFVEDTCEELVVLRAIDLEDPQRSPCVHRWIDVVE